jgi:DNA-binding GntR family transcriptional regulator
MDTNSLAGRIARPSQTFSGQAVEVLREMVIAGELVPGERLNEVELAAALGISRGPLREAIQRLNSEGLVSMIPNRGAFVRTFSTDELAGLYEVRIALETHALRLAADANAEGIAQLQKMLVDTGAALDEHPTYPRDLDFHKSVVELTGNPILLEAVIEVHRKIDLARSRSGREPQRARRALGEHEGILQDMIDGRIAHAQKTLTKHLRSSLANALKILKSDESDAGAERAPS